MPDKPFFANLRETKSATTPEGVQLFRKTCQNCESEFMGTNLQLKCASCRASRHEEAQIEEIIMPEAFDKFHYWNSADTLLKLIISETSIGPEIFFVNVASVDEESRLVGFVDPKTRSFLPPVNFSDAICIVSQYALEAVRPTGDLLICEEKIERQSA